ncbi:MAG: leucine-rich repeat domain-containing protein [Clostridia bacterium]|nr:leucine-rich repeat domain-containing protein [Clostridia bacterium]
MKGRKILCGTLAVLALASMATATACDDVLGSIEGMLGIELPFGNEGDDDKHECEWGEWTVTIQATCEGEGEEKRVCQTNELHEEKRPVLALGHDVETHGGKDATCEETGWKAYETCKRENCEYTTYEEIGLAEHSFLDGFCETCELPDPDYNASLGLAFTLSEDETYYSVSGMGTCTDTDIVIPATYKKLPVTAIAANAFANDTKLKSVTIPSSITLMEQNAFSFCTKLESVYIADLADWFNITFANAFANPLNLYAKTLYANDQAVVDLVVPDAITEIKQYAFYWYSGLKSVVIPESVTALGTGCFTSAYNLESVTINGSIKTLQGFSNCRKLTSITIAGDVEQIASSAFFGCESLKEMTIPETVKSIGANSFSDCIALTSIVIPDSVTNVGSSAFMDCSAMTSITAPFVGAREGDRKNNFLGYFFGAPRYEDNKKYVPQSLKTVVVTRGEIADFAFYYCEKVESITLPSTIKTIGEKTFYECRKLKDFVIPASVTTIERNAFMWCSSLTNLEIPSAVSTIEMEAFWGCSALQEITIPDGITAIEAYTFCNCTQLKKVTMPNSVKIIKMYAFYHCHQLTEVNFSNTLQEIDGFAFAECQSLESVTIPNSVTLIRNAFQSCYSLTNVVLPDSLKDLSEEIFLYCSNIKGIEYENGIYLGNTKNPYFILLRAVSTDITSVVVHKDTKLIHTDAFKGCENLTDINIEASLTRLAFRAFRGCKSLTNIVLPDTLTTIGQYAFEDCVNLKSVTFSSAVNLIELSAFEDCSLFTDVYYKGTAEQFNKMRIEGGNTVVYNATIHYVEAAA